MRWLQNFMRGRYGVDQLSFALLIIYFIITITSMLTGYPMVGNFALLIVFYCWFRIFSRNTYKRSGENTKYLQMTYPMRTWFARKKKRHTDKKTYKFYKCPSCKQELRVPKGKGNLTITCPKCKTKFDKRT